MKVRDVKKKLEEAGWHFDHVSGDHHHVYKKDGETNHVTISGHDRDDVLAGQLSDIRRKSGLPLR